MAPACEDIYLRKRTRLRTTAIDAPVYIMRKLQSAHQHWINRASGLSDSDEKKRPIQDYARFVKGEFDRMNKRWIKPRLQQTKP